MVICSTTNSQLCVVLMHIDLPLQLSLYPCVRQRGVSHAQVGLEHLVSLCTCTGYTVKLHKLRLCVIIESSAEAKSIGLYVWLRVPPPCTQIRRLGVNACRRDAHFSQVKDLGCFCNPEKTFAFSYAAQIIRSIADVMRTCPKSNQESASVKSDTYLQLKIFFHCTLTTVIICICTSDSILQHIPSAP